ncbi:MAG: primosomal protein N' [Bdellovibrionota bacterium]
MAHQKVPRKVRYALVAVPGVHQGLFTYRVPEALEELAHPGHRVLVPFGRRRLVGILWSLDEKPPEGLAPGKIRDLEDVLDSSPIVGRPLRELCAWVARYYHAPLGEVARLAGPPGAGWARGPERVRLTVPPEGELVDVAGLPSATREVYYAALALLGGEGSREIPAATLARKAGREALHHRLRVLERAGAVSIEWEGARLGAAARESSWWEAVPAEPADLEAAFSRAPKQSEIYRALTEDGASDTADLEERFPGAASALRGLEERGLVRREKRARHRDPWAEVSTEFSEAPVPTAAQARALQALERSLGEGGFSVHLLWGVTGSGKTEVYLRAIERVLSLGKTALVLVPEIALTPQLAIRFRARLGEHAAVLHSGLSKGERHDEWQRLRAGQARVALGVRSALFSPLPNLGLLVVDEEHEGTYKQEDVPAYHARDSAIKRAQIEGAAVLLGSATPSLESLSNVRAGRYQLLELPERVGGRSLPTVEIVDLRAKGKQDSGERIWFLSSRLEKELERVLGEGEQAILYQNRRGFATTLLCHECGTQLSCPNCSVRLRVHEEGGRLLCHYCGYASAVPQTCASCGGTRLAPAGLGTQQVERAVAKRFPQARVARLDRDALARKGELFRIVEKMRRREIDVLVGTQMVTKGHDFPAVTLVGVLLADLAWSIPDFRAEEEAWQSLAQVAGRAGRGDKPGLVLLQTFDPESPLLSKASESRLWEFAGAELESRAALGYPPAWRLAAARISSGVSAEAERGARWVADCLREVLERPGVEAKVLGPAPSPLARLRGRYRWQVLAKAREAKVLQEALAFLERRAPGAPSLRSARLFLDVDPRSLL